MKRKLTMALLVAFVLLAAAAAVLAQSSASFSQPRHVIAGGGGLSGSAGFLVQGTIGQSMAGSQRHTSANYAVVSGYWAGGGVHTLFLPVVMRD